MSSPNFLQQGNIDSTKNFAMAIHTQEYCLAWCRGAASAMNSTVPGTWCHAFPLRADWSCGWSWSSDFWHRFYGANGALTILPSSLVNWRLDRLVITTYKCQAAVTLLHRGCHRRGQMLAIVIWCHRCRLGPKTKGLLLLYSSALLHKFALGFYFKSSSVSLKRSDVKVRPVKQRGGIKLDPKWATMCHRPSHCSNNVSIKESSITSSPWDPSRWEVPMRNHHLSTIERRRR